MKRQATPEQKAKAEARRAKFRALAKQISAMSDEARQALAARLPGICTVEGRALSLHNACLIAVQKPDATLVGGFRQWLGQGRCVRKGECGLMIWVPISHGAKGEESAISPAVLSNEQRTSSEDRPGFIMGTVFDVSQTAELEQKQADADPCEGRTIWNSDGTNGPCLICPPPSEQIAA